MGASYRAAMGTKRHIESLADVLGQIIDEREAVDDVETVDDLDTDRITKLEDDFGDAIAELRKTVHNLENQMQRAWEF